MADETPRRRLKLMNEVLPSPTASDATSPRARTLSHLQRLMSAAALLAACNKQSPGTGQPGYGVVDPMPPPALDRDKPDSGAAADASAATPTSSVASPLAIRSAVPVASSSAAPPNPPPIGHGYGVVDPMPTPAQRVHKSGEGKPPGKQ